MKLYCKVENNEVVSPPSVLHPSLQFKSDFELLEAGWYLAEQHLPDTFDERFEVMMLEYELHQYKVVVNYTKRYKTEEELTEFINGIRTQLEEQRQLELTQCYQMLDKNSNAFWNLTEPEKIKWQDYQDALTNLFNTDKNIWEIEFPKNPNQPTPKIPQLPDLPTN